jgi:citrate lyase subunit beta/citryl-CoA lyase
MMINPLNPKHLMGIKKSGADMVTLNLEDAIAPSRKREALDNIISYLKRERDSKSFVIVRTNPLGSGGEEEIEALNHLPFDAIRVSKIKNQTEVALALNLLSLDKELHISLETKEAFESLASLRIDERFTVANLGILDLLTSLNLPQSIVTLGNPTIEYILSKFLVEARSVGLLPISFMYQEYKNTHIFEEWCKKEREMGFSTKACMGPLQVEIANRVFGISDEQIARATHIKRVFEGSSSMGINGFMDSQYGFIDEPIYRDALLVLG